MPTTNFELPWQWTNDYIREKIRKNAVVKKRRDAIKKSKKRYMKF